MTSVEPLAFLSPLGVGQLFLLFPFSLLARVDESQMLASFPVNPLSSQGQDACSVGVMALWLVEAIRADLHLLDGRLGLVPEIVSELLTWRRLTAEAAPVADEEPAEGPLHATLKLSARGEQVLLGGVGVVPILTTPPSISPRLEPSACW